MQIPYTRVVAVAARTAQFPEGLCDALYIGAAGTLTIVLQGGNSVALPCIAGQTLPIKASYVSSLGAATSVFAFYR